MQGETGTITAQSQPAAKRTEGEDSADSGESLQAALDQLSKEAVFFPNCSASAWVAARGWEQHGWYALGEAGGHGNGRGVTVPEDENSG